MDTQEIKSDKPQINFGISTGINNIPTAITIQRGNVQDKKHFREMLKIVSKVIPENSLLIFDSGANTKANKQKIRSMNYHYLTLKPKNVGTYKRFIEFFNENLKKENYVHFVVNERNYYCVKKIRII